MEMHDTRSFRSTPLLRWGFVALLGLCGTVRVQGQLVINQSQPPTTLVQNLLLGPGVFASTVLFNGMPGSTSPGGEEADRFARFNGTNSNVGLAGGIVLHTGDVNVLPGPNDQILVAAGGFPFNATPDLDLGQLSGDPYWHITGGSNIYNKSILEFDFIPTHDMVRFRYVFSSEEYEKWACSSYNDAFGFFLSGPGISGPYLNGAINIAHVPGTLTPVSINTVNSGMNANNANGPVLDPFGPCYAASATWMDNTEYYIYNGSWGPQGGGAQVEAPYCCDPYYIEHNGLTVVLEATAAVQCGELYHMKLAIGNVADWRYPSAVFLEQGSFSSSDRFSLDVRPGPNVEMSATDTVFIETGCDSVYLQFHRHGGFYLDEDLEITVGGTATSGVDYLDPLPATVHFNVLDSMVTIPIAVPLDDDDVEELVITIVTCEGLKLQTYVFTIDQRPPLEVVLEDQEAECPGTFTLAPEVSGGSGDPANYTYLWSTGATTPSISVFVDETTQFWVTVSDSCWTDPVTDSAWVVLPIRDPLAVTLPTEVVVPCLGSIDVEAIATGGAGGYTYVWTNESGTVGTSATITVPFTDVGEQYTVEVTDQCGQTVTASFVPVPGPTPPLTIEAYGDTVTCAGMDAVLEVVHVGGGGGAYTYAWGVPPGPVTSNEPTLTVRTEVDSYYTVTVTDECGNSIDTTLAAIIMDHPPLVISVPNDTIVCPGEEVPLWVLIEGGAGNYTVEWPGLGSGEVLTWIAEPGGVMAVVNVTDLCGVTATDSLMVDVYPAEAEIEALQLGESIWRFTALYGPEEGSTLHWDLGDGTTANTVIVTHTYLEFDAFEVLLQVTTEDGCIAEDRFTTRPPTATIYFPNAFTPNGDDRNEGFGGEGRLIDEYNLLIFDRWGSVLFESNDMAVRWDGRSADGEEVMNGVYQYKYRVKGFELPRREGYGHVVLVR